MRLFVSCLVLSAGLHLSAPAHAAAEPPSNAAAAPPAECRAAPGGLAVSRRAYAQRLHGFWLGLSIGNWTGLVTEMDKIGGPGPAGRFYTRADWGKPDQPSIWGQGVPSDLSPTIDWVVRRPGEVWGSDDDSDIELIYLHLMHQSGQPLLSAEQIRQGWLRHIYSDADTPHRTADGKPENYLWVSNQQAFDLMQQGWLPPLTGMPPQNPHYDMIDAQLTTELFGTLAPGRPDVAARLADLPIRTTAAAEAVDIAQFYVALHAGAAVLPAGEVADAARLRTRVLALADEARRALPSNQYPARMYDFVRARHRAGQPWEQVRDALYRRYQVEQRDGYEVTRRRLYCNGCFAAGINFAASLVSLFYGAGDMQQTLKIAVLAGWDSDNPAATWGGLYGLMLGPAAIEQRFGALSDRFNLHRTRRGFPNDGQFRLQTLAQMGVDVMDRVLVDLPGAERSADGDCWRYPMAGAPVPAATAAN